MNKKWLAISMIGIVLAGAAFALVVFWPPTPGVTYANYSRIETGMSREQVNALLGPPRRQGKGAGMFVNPEDAEPGIAWARWNRGEDEVIVQYDEDDRVIACAWNFIMDQRNGWEKLRDRTPFIAKEPPQILHIF
jgi:hypothetical protein